jgi:hypothetical protein
MTSSRHSSVTGLLGRALFFSFLSVVSSHQGWLFAQAYSRMEIGIQGAALRLADPADFTDEKGGFGARVGYNFSPLLAWEAEGDFFPTNSLPYGAQRGGRAYTLLAGPKVGWRWRRVGLFLKVRPGVVNFSDAPRIETGILPSGEPYFREFPGLHLTHLALDLGGAMEINTGRRTFIRVDVSEMLLRYGDRTYHIPEVSGFVTAPGVIGNSLLVTAGFSYRLGGFDTQSISIWNTRRWEIGGQFGVLSIGSSELQGHPLSLGDYQNIGERLTCNLNRWLAIDSVLNYFYTNPNAGDAQRGGRILQGSFGPKAGIHLQRFGFFAKVRPGFLSYGGVHDDLFPPFPTTRLTHFAVDFGGVLEYYPSRRTMLRFDLGHTVAYYGSARVIAPSSPPFNGGYVNPAFRDNAMQFTTGFGWRF